MSFLPIPWYEWLYSFDTTSWQVWSLRKKQFLVPRPHRWYKSVMLYSASSKRKRYKTHQIIAMLFLPEDITKTQINHIDGNKWNDALDNLERCTAGENVRHARDVLKKQFWSHQGRPMSEETKQKLRWPRQPYGQWALDDPRRERIRNLYSKPVSCYTITWEFVATYPSMTIASRTIGKAISGIVNCIAGRKKTSGWFVWKLTESI